MDARKAPPNYDPDESTTDLPRRPRATDKAAEHPVLGELETEAVHTVDPDTMEEAVCIHSEDGWLQSTEWTAVKR